TILDLLTPAAPAAMGLLQQLRHRHAENVLAPAARRRRLARCSSSPRLPRPSEADAQIPAPGSPPASATPRTDRGRCRGRRDGVAHVIRRRDEAFRAVGVVPSLPPPAVAPRPALGPHPDLPEPSVLDPGPSLGERRPPGRRPCPGSVPPRPPDAAS